MTSHCEQAGGRRFVIFQQLRDMCAIGVLALGLLAACGEDASPGPMAPGGVAAVQNPPAAVGLPTGGDTLGPPTAPPPVPPAVGDGNGMPATGDGQPPVAPPPPPTPVDPGVPPTPTPGGDGDGDGTTPPEAGDGAVDPATLEPFSFFVTSLDGMRELSDSRDGFGGDLGGLEGADSICQRLADRVGFGAKTWRAFLSVTDGGDGNPVHAADRVGDGPWYDRNGRLVAEDLQGLLNERPDGDAQTINDLPDEHGTALTELGDSHDIITGSNEQGRLAHTELERTCNDWTSTTVNPQVGGGGFGLPGFLSGVQLGHSWPSDRSGRHWITVHTASSCGAGVNLEQNGPGDGSSIGAGGGWGAIYCFALEP